MVLILADPISSCQSKTTIGIDFTQLSIDLLARALSTLHVIRVVLLHTEPFAERIFESRGWYALCELDIGHK